MRDFKHTMDLLVKAYLNDTLRHGSCCACAVGNICGGSHDWSLFFVTQDGRQLNEAYLDAVFYRYLETNVRKLWKSKGIETIKKTGYTIQELARVEFAFETAPYGGTDDDWMFNGLLAVLEVLADIHKVDFSGQQVYEKQLEEIFATK